MHSNGNVHGLFRAERVVAILFVGPGGRHFRPQSDGWPLAVVVATEAGSLKGLFGEIIRPKPFLPRFPLETQQVVDFTIELWFIWVVGPQVGTTWTTLASSPLGLGLRHVVTRGI